MLDKVVSQDCKKWNFLQDLMVCDFCDVLRSLKQRACAECVCEDACTRLSHHACNRLQ